MRPEISTLDPYDHNLAVRNTVGDMLTRAVDLTPRKTAVVDGSRRFDYATLEHDSEAFARGLIGLSNAPAQGAPVALILPNSYEFLVAYFGIVKAGRVVLPINYGLSAEGVAWIIGDAEAKHIIAHESFLPLVREVVDAGTEVETAVVYGLRSANKAPPGTTFIDFATLLVTPVGAELRLLIRSDDVAQCLYTSGTTATPKSSLATHNSIVTGVMSNVLTVGESWVKNPPVAIVVLPLFHVTALDTLTVPVLAVGGTVVLHDGFDPGDVLDDMEQERATIFTGLPMMWAALIAEFGRKQRDLSSMTMAMYAMAQMPERVLDGMDAMLPQAHKLLGSGQTEVIPATTFQRPEHRRGKQASWGISATTVRTRIMGDDGRLLPPGETGEIVYRGPHVTAGYWKDSRANEEAFRHGWFHSGDIGYIDAQGVVWFTDRAKDIIKTGGENVSSVKVERIMANAPGVVECCVVGVADDYWGEAVTLAVVSDALPTVADGQTAKVAQVALERELADYAKRHLGRFEVPKRYAFLAELPKTATGKIRKNIVRDRISGE